MKIKKTSRRHTSSQVKTTPADNTMTTKPEKISKKMPVIKTRIQKVPRASLPNMAGVETTSQRSNGPGMNTESNNRKSLRMKQGL